ncbi:MAG: S9 family peptidase [Hymenobacteraceae bacterium]|nr:S9 family peptidase [Hymenobacteraceae bacterium]
MTLRPLRAALLILLTSAIAPAFAQQKKNLTLEDIWAKRDLFAASPEGTNWLKDGRYYTALVPDEKNQTQDIVRFDITTGQPVNTLVEGESLKGAAGPLTVDGYTFSSDEQRLLITTAEEPIYRRSSKAEFYLYDLKKKELKSVSKGGKQQYAAFSPDGERVAFVRQNNLYYVDVAGGQEHKVTEDGTVNQRINGALDWVYEEEFEFAVGFGWSPDGGKLAFYTFDESRVPEYAMQQWGKLYPTSYLYKYPKAGEVNSVVGVKVFDLVSGKTTTLDTGKEPDQYLPRMKWTQNANLVAVQRLNRLQNKLELLHCNATTGKSDVVLTETDKAYVEVGNDLTYLKDGKNFVWSSERDGYQHLYLYALDGKKSQQLTKGAWDVTDFHGVDEARGLVYYAAAETHPRERQLYRIDLSGKNKTRLSQGAGTHEGAFSPTFSYYFDTHGSFGTPPVTTLFDATGKAPRQIKVVEDNAALKTRLAQFTLSPVEFIEVPLPGDEKLKLNGWMLKPTNFDATKKYPAILYVYGGPGSQTGQDDWAGPNYFWFQLLAEQGYVIISVDNRGTGARGAAFKKSTYANLGKLEIQDQMDVARWAGSQAYIDKARIGMWGWSYGGYMTSLAMTKGADLFKTGVAVAPVTNWRFYDTVYTERFLKTPQENPAGYDENSPVSHAGKLKGNFLMIHGTGDDNVHFQNAVALEDALIKANKQFTSFYYPNRNHGIYGGVTRLHLYRMMTDYFVKDL